QQVEQVIVEVMKFVRKDKIVACTNCGMAPMRRDVAEAKLKALAQGVALARKKFG
ncbi:MAG: methionine synthase, partial [Pseudolabrys sp.]